MVYSDVENSSDRPSSLSRNHEFRALVENTPDIILQITPDLRVRYANASLAYELGILPEDIIEHPISALGLPQAVLDDWQSAIEQVIRTCQEQHIEFDLPTLSGAIFWYARVVPELRADQTLASILVISRDVTRLKMTELALRQSEIRYRAILENQVELVCRFTLDGRLSFVNDACCRFLGCDRATLLQTSILAWFPEADQPHIEQHLTRLQHRLNDRVTLETRIFDPQGAPFWFQWVIQGILNDQDDVVEFQAVGHNIQTRKTMEAALRQRVERERTLNRVIQVIRNSLDLSTVFLTATAEVAQLLSVDRVGIFQYLPDTNTWIGRADYCQDATLARLIDRPMPDAQERLANRLKQAEIVRLSNTDAMEAATSDAVVNDFPGAWMWVPLVVQSRVWGTLALNQAQASHTWTDSEVELACIIADQLAIAIQQSQLYSQVQHLNASLERQVRVRTAELQLAYEFEATLKRITDRVRDSLDEDQILQTAVQELALGMGVLCCNAAIFDLEQGTSIIRYEYTTALSPSQGKASRMADFPELYEPLLQGICFQFCSILPHPLRDRSAILACPIQDDQGVLGDLWLISHSYHAYHDPAIRLVEQVASQCAIAIRQARLYQTAQTQVTALERLNSLKDDFLSTVSHELRTPMANLKMAAQMLDLTLSRTGILDPATRQKHPEIDRYFRILHDECQREISLINDLLDLSRIDAGTEPLTLAPIHLHDWLPSLLATFTERAKSQQQALSLNLPTDLPPLLTDSAHLERILSELLNNACKYTPPGEQIWLTARLPAGHPSPAGPQAGPQAGSQIGKQTDPPTTLELIVTNTGVEIPTIERDRIFEKFYRIPNNDPWRHGGTGLGLALCKKLAEQLGGTLRADGGNCQTHLVLTLPYREPRPLDNNPP